MCLSKVVLAIGGDVLGILIFIHFLELVFLDHLLFWLMFGVIDKSKF